MKNNFIVISLGGSIIVSKKIQIQYLKRLYDFINRQIDEGKRFILVVGGGSIARDYQKAASQIAHTINEDKDWLGIHSTRLNAHLLRTIFRERAYPVVLDSPQKQIKKRDLDKYALFIASGSRPGWSTDYIAFKLAHRFGQKEVLIATKIPYIYDRDISQFKDAKPIKELTWNRYKELLPSEVWIPGMSAPIDPIATNFAIKNKMTCVLLRGTNIKNLDNFFDGKGFDGTRIK